ncbi:hypothetical protein [Kamptonema formosum]|nr:hypothetical protein [Oscillatoria sp. PCC 10802]
MQGGDDSGLAQERGGGALAAGLASGAMKARDPNHFDGWERDVRRGGNL